MQYCKMGNIWGYVITVILFFLTLKKYSEIDSENIIH